MQIKINKNAIDVLWAIMQNRNWHNSTIQAQKATRYKDLLKKKQLSYEKCSEILKSLGYEKIKDEIWQNKGY